MLNLLAVLSLEELMRVCDAFKIEVEKAQQLEHQLKELISSSSPSANHSSSDNSQAPPLSATGITAKTFVALLLPFVIEALIRHGFEPPSEEEDHHQNATSSPPMSPFSIFANDAGVASASFASATTTTTTANIDVSKFLISTTSPSSSLTAKQQMKLSKIAQKEIRDLFRTVDVKQKNQIDWTDLLRYFVDEIDRRSVGADQGGLSGERISKLSSVGETLSFEQATVGSHSIYTVAHVTPTPDRRNSNVSLFVAEWSGYVFAVSEGGKQGFELVDAATLQTVRLGFHQNQSAHEKLSSILQAVAIPKFSMIVACHHDATVTFWSLPGTGHGDRDFLLFNNTTTNHENNINNNNNNKSKKNFESQFSTRSSIVCFKKLNPNEMPEHVRVFHWNAETCELFSGSSTGVIRKWILSSGSSTVERHAPNLKEFVQAHSTNITQILSVGSLNRLVSLSMDRTVCLVDTTSMVVVDKRGGRSVGGYKGQNHSQGILAGCIVEYDRNEIVVATAGFDEDILLWTLFTSGLSSAINSAMNNSNNNNNNSNNNSDFHSNSNNSSNNFVMSMMKPSRMTDHSNPHRGAIYSISKLSHSKSSLATHSHLLVSGDAVGIVKIWDTRILRCIQSIQACRLGDDDPPPPMIISNSAISALVIARKAQAEIIDADSMSAQTRRAFKGTSVQSGQQRHFIYSVDPKTSALFATGPRSSYLLRGHVPRSPERCDDFSVLAAVQIPEIGCILTLHNDCTKMWQLSSGALTSVHSIFRSNLTCVTVDKQSRCYFVGDSKGVVSCHSTYSGSIASKWKVFPNGDPISSIRSMRRKDGVHLLFAISDVGGVSVTQTDEDFYDRQLEKDGGSNNNNNNNNDDDGNTSKKKKNKINNNKKSKSELADEALLFDEAPDQRKIHQLNAVITRNIGLLQRFLDATNQLAPNIISVSQDGRVDHHAAFATLVRTGTTLRSRSNRPSRNRSRGTNNRDDDDGEGDDVQDDRESTKKGKSLIRSGSSFFHQKNRKSTSNSKKEDQQSATSSNVINNSDTSNNNSISNPNYEDEVDFVTIIAYQEVSLVMFVAGPLVLVLDIQSLEIVHSFHVGCNRRIVAACDLGTRGAICVVDNECGLTVFGVRPSHLSNQILCVKDLSKAHPSKWWVKAVKEQDQEEKQLQQQQQQQCEQNNDNGKITAKKMLLPPFAHATPTTMAFHSHTCSIVVGDADGAVSCWSLRNLKRELFLRPMRYPPENARSARIQSRFLRRLQNVVVPADVIRFGNSAVEFECRRGPGKSLDSILSSSSTVVKSKPSKSHSSHQNHKKNNNNDHAADFGLPFITVPVLRIDDEDEDDENECFGDDVNSDRHHQQKASSLLLPAVDTSLHTMKTSMKLPFANARSIRDAAWSGMFEDEEEEFQESEESNNHKFEEDDDLFLASNGLPVANSTAAFIHAVNDHHQKNLVNPLAKNDHQGMNKHENNIEMAHVGNNNNHHQHHHNSTGNSDFGVRELVALYQTGNRVGFLSVGGSDCRVVLLSRGMKNFGELQQSRTREKLGHELVSTEEQVLFRFTSPKNNDGNNNATRKINGKDDDTQEDKKSKFVVRNQGQMEASARRDHKRFLECRKEEAEAGTIPWRYYDLKEELESFLDPVVDLTEGVVSRMRKFVHDVKFKMAYNKHEIFTKKNVGNPGAASSSNHSNKEFLSLEVARKLNLFASKDNNNNNSSLSNVKHHSSNEKENPASSPSAKTQFQNNPDQSPNLINRNNNNNNILSVSVPEGPAMMKTNVNNGHGTSKRTLSFMFLGNNNEFSGDVASSPPSGRVSVLPASGKQSRTESRNTDPLSLVHGRTSRNNNNNNNGFLSTTNTHSTVDAFGKQFLHSKHDDDDDDDDKFPIQTFSPVPKHKAVLNKHHQQQDPSHQSPSPTKKSSVNHATGTHTLVSQYHNVASPPTSLQRRRFQLNSNYTVTLPPLELNFKEVIRDAEEAWKTGRTTDSKTISSSPSPPRRIQKQKSESNSNSLDQGESNNNNSNSFDSYHMDEISTRRDTTMSVNRNHHHHVPTISMTNPNNNSNNHNSPNQKNPSSSYTARLFSDNYLPRSGFHLHNQYQQPSLGLSGEEIVRIRETVKSSRELLASVPKVRMVPTQEDMKMPQTSRRLNLPPMKL